MIAKAMELYVFIFLILLIWRLEDLIFQQK